MNKILYTVIFCIFSLYTAYAQFVPITNCPQIKINSGNPAFPFPQFLEYKAGKTLAKYNSEGVTHADMEKTMREAYEIMSHRCRLTGQTYCGVPYINFNNNTVPHNFNTFVSEGDGYMLMAAAIFADQPTFNGLWMWIHDNRMSKVIKYKDCQPLRPTQKTGPYIAGWNCTETTPANDGSTHSATDGDFDIAMGLLIAYRQWGEFMYHNGTLVKDACGNPISLKEAAEKAIKALVDTIPDYMDNGAFAGYMSGIIGIDGYIKSGNTWGELTMWRATQNTYPWAKALPTLGGNYGAHYFDYNAPAYCREFAYFLETEGNGTPWQINQFKRAEASSDWLMGQAYAQGYIPSIGKVYCTTDGTFTFGSFNSGEDFRASWRTILNYVWNGNPTTKWDPVTHQVVNGANTYERDMAIRHAAMLKEPKAGGTVRCKKMGASPDPGQPMWKGEAQIPQSWDLNGNILEQAGSNYALGTGAPAAVASGDLELIADMYRQSELVWDDASTESKNLTDDQRYIMSTPKYFHGMFRVLGLLTNSGNLHAPKDMKPGANMKVYMSVNKTYVYAGDLLTYTVDYRNYGSLDATGVKITTPLDSEYELVSASNGGTLQAGSIVWNIGTVPGFKSATGIPPTTGKVTFTVRVKTALHPYICLQSTITATNCDSWTSNEYPNNATYTMERNCVDILANRSLIVNKTANRTEMNPANEVNFRVDFENKSTADSWLNGGRDHVILSYGNFIPPGGGYSSTSFYQLFRFWNDAQEAYINMNNYRISYFMNDAAAMGLYNATTNPTGWTFQVDNQNDLDKYGYNPASGPITFAYQKIPNGSDANGAWNQRLMIRFANTLMATSTHVYDKLDSKYLLHKGVWGPALIRAVLSANPTADMIVRTSDDWSYSSAVKSASLDGQGETFTPISPGWANRATPNKPITNYSRHSCSPDRANYDRILVEEFDGYTWRRILGRGPLPGKEAEMVVVVDTIPKEFTWKAFKTDKALGVTATYTPAPNGANYTGIVKWQIPSMLVGEKGFLEYTVIAAGTCPMADKNVVNKAWIYSSTDSPTSSEAPVKITCDFVPEPITPTSITKTADKTTYAVNDNIVYTIDYVQKQGAIAIDPLTATSTTSNWVAPAGSPGLPTNVGGDLTVPWTDPKYFYNKYSHGTNGTLTFTIDLTTNGWNSFSLLFRYKSGKPGTAGFDGVALNIWPGKNGIGAGLVISCMNNNTLVRRDGETSPLSYSAPATPLTITVRLLDDKMSVWVNSDPETNTPLVTYSGLKIQAGYVGFYNGKSDSGLSGGGENSNNYRIKKWDSRFDSAFDLEISDVLPTVTSFVSATNSGTHSAGKVTWPIVGGPVLYNTPFQYKVTTKLTSCPTSGKIVNYAYVNGYGFKKDSLAAMNIVNCGAPPCPAAPTVTAIVTYCKGATATALTATGTALKWYTVATGGSGSTTAPTPSTASAGTTSYYVTQTTNGCESPRAKIDVVVIETAKPTVITPVTICKDATATALTATGTDLKWYNSANTLLSVAPTPITTTVGNTDYFVTQTLNSCESDKEKITVSIIQTAAPTVTTPVNYCLQQTATALTATGTALKWYTVATGGTSSSTAPTPTTTTVGTTNYYVSQTLNSCESPRSLIAVNVTAIPEATITANKTKYCGTTSDVTLTVTPKTGINLTGASYKWYRGTTLISGATSNTLTSGVTTGSYTVEITLNNCTYTTPAVVITGYDRPEYTITGNGSYCPESTSKTPVVITFTKGTAPFTFDEAVTGTGKSSATATYTITNPAAGTYIPSNIVDANGCTGVANTASVTVTDLTTPNLTIAALPNSCDGVVSTVNIATYVTAAAGTRVYSTDKGTITSAGLLTLAGAGLYTITVELTGSVAPGCKNTKTATLNVWENPSVSISPATISTCSNVPVTVTANATGGSGVYTGTGAGYTWTDASNSLSSTIIAAPSFQKSVATNQTYPISVQVTDNRGCKGSANTSVQVRALPTATLSASQNPVCIDAGTVTITATPSSTGGVGTWSGATKVNETTATFDLSSLGTITSPTTQVISYKYVASAANGSCEMAPAAQLTLTVNPQPQVVMQSASTCSSIDNVNLRTKMIVSEPTGTGTFTGYTPATTGVSLSPTGIFTHGGKNGVYTISYSFTANGCTKVFTQTFTVNANLTPDITANPGFEVCQNQSIQLGISGGPFASQTWSGSAAPYLGGATTIANPSMSGAPANTYTISAQVTDANGCTGTATKSIIINSVPTVTLATPDNTHCVSETTPQVITATISPATTVGTGTWSANVTKTSETTATFTPSVAGATASPHTITYNFTSNKGCAATAVTQQMIVYALPTVTITRSREHACESGNNSSVITFTTTGTTGGTSVFSSSTASVNSSTGALDPTAAANKPVAPATVISHTVKLDYTDANNCKAQAFTTVDVHALPTVSFGTNPTTKCVYDAPFTLNVNPIAVAPATGVFGGSVSSATFTPATATIGTNPITYTYRDAYGCEQIANYSISVVKIDVPTVTAPNPKTIVVGVDDSFSEPANVHASGTYTTEWMDASCNTLIQVGGIYTPGLTAADLGANQTKTFTYKVRQHDAVSGCVSECSDAILTLSRCPALTPSAVDPYYCVGESGAVTATAVPQGTQGAGDKLTWFANSDKTGMLNDGTTYTSTLTTTAATSQKVYVAQWNQANACYSAAKEVTIRVVDNPTVSLSIENKDCATAGIRQITTVPSTGTLTETSSVGGLNIAARTWDPMAGGAPSPSKTLNVSYVVSETQPDDKVCSTTKTASATSHFMIAPTPTHKNWLIDDIDNIPADYMTATTSSTGTTISWYGSQSKTPVLAANSFNYTPNKAALKAEVAAAGNPDTYVKTYWITQTNAQGCESEPVAVTLTLVKCPFMAPSVSGTEKCAGEVLPAISASTTNTVDTWKWYKADQTTPIANATASYTHDVSNTVAGTTDFYVSYVATETNTGKQCESHKSKVSVVVNPLPDFIMQLSKTGTICYDDSDVEISVIPNTGTTISSVNYDINTDPNRVQKSGIKGYINPDAPVMGYTVPGLYPIQINAEVTNQFGCKITKNITSSVRWTSLPIITNVIEVLDIANTNPITITAAGTAVNWYNSASKTGSLATNTNSYTTSITRTTVSNTTLYATQTLDGCESQTALGTIQVIDCPFAAPDATSIAACPGLPLTDITATTTNTAIQWKWFDESNTVLPTSTATLTHGVANTTETIKKFYVQYESYDSGSGKTCWSPKKEVTVQVYKKPMVFFTDAVHTLCYDSGPHFLENIVNMGNGNPNITWTINGGTTGIKNGVVDPTFNGPQSGNYTVEAIITDSKGCTSTETCIVRINYVPEPTPIGYFELKKPSTPVQVSVSGIVTTPIAGSVQWLNESGTVISTSNPYVTGLNSNTEIKTYAIARQKIGNCYSDTIQVPIQIIDCPVPSPQVNISPSATICNYDAVPQIQTSIGSTWLQGTRPTPVIPVEFRLYSQATGGVAISSNTTGNFTPVLANMSQGGNYDFWIAEYNPNVIPQGCESVLRTKVTIQVNKTPAVGIVGQKDVCEQTANAQLQIKDVLPNAVVEWYTSMPNIPSVTPPVAQGMYYTPSVTNVGTHTVYAAQRLNGCMSELAQVSFTIKPLPAPPVTLPASVCQGQPHVALQATGTGITWYQNANKTGVKLLTNSNTYIPTVDNTTTFYASQTVNECESSTAPVVYTVKSIPAKPIIQTKDKSCDTETEHILSVTPETGSVIRWYSSPDTSSYLTSGNEYKHQIQGVSGQKTYYARKFVDGCISDVSSKYFTIVPTPQPPVITNTTVCKQSNATLISDDNDNEWYSDQTLQTMVFKGRNYTVNQVISNQTLYVIKNKFTCTSSPVEANITVVNPTIDIGKNIEACVGDPVATLTAAISPAIQNAQDIVEWKINPGNAIIKSNAPVSLAGYITTADIRTDINYTITARYQVKLATATCYSNIDTLIYTVHKRAHTPIVFSNVICQGQSLEPLKALGTPNLTWTSNHPLIPSPVKGREYNFAQQGITTLPEGTYSFELIDESEFGCKSLIATPSITVAPAARTKIIGDSTVCEYTIEQLYTLEYVPQQPSSYKWEVTGKHVNYTKDANASNIRYVDWGKAGIDTLRVYERTFYGCDGYDELIVNIAEYPIAKFTYTMPGAVDVVWFSDSTIQKPIVEITDTGETVTIPISYTMYWNFDQLGETYYDRIVPYSQRKEIVEATGYTYGYKNPELMVENEYGCRSTYSKEINININAAIFVPTAFSPTNAAYSVHYFQPVGYNIKTCEIWIYDLWGNLVWYSNEVENGIFVGKWDGTYNGELLKADTYIWKMEAELLNGQSWNGKEAANGKISKFGSVALIR